MQCSTVHYLGVDPVEAGVVAQPHLLQQGGGQERVLLHRGQGVGAAAFIILYKHKAKKEVVTPETDVL